MKTIRPTFLDCEIEKLEKEAGSIGISVKQLVHDRAMGLVPEDAPLSSAKLLADEIAKCRATMNQIFRRQMSAEIRLYEDDVIRLEMMLDNIEAMIAAYISQEIKEVQKDGDIEIQPN